MRDRMDWWRLASCVVIVSGCGLGTSVVGGPVDAAVDTGVDVALDVTLDVRTDLGAMDVPAADVMMACRGNTDCVGNAAGPVCNTATGRCVACTPADDRCPAAQRCDPAAFACVAGCRNDDACAAIADGGVADGGVSGLRCEPTTHACVACVIDDHCTLGQRCMGNQCVPGCDPVRGCAAGQTCCGGCIDTATNTGNCGTCGTTCMVSNGVPACLAGVCGVASCGPGFADCDSAAANGCEIDTRVTLTHCGACNNVCPARANASPTCAAGACGFVCDAGFADCDGSAANGCEVDTRVTLANCGACGTACPTRANAAATCAAGACGFTCSAGFANCDGNAANGCEVDTRVTLSNCGMCGNVCPARTNGSATCTAGVCGLTCTTGFGNCDGNAANGCEVDTRVTLANCGTCGTVCPVRTNAAATCAAGTCGLTCRTGFGNCDGVATNGCEVDTFVTLAHCGACGNACPARANATLNCTAGACGFTCVAGFANCNGNAADGCEANLAVSASSCGTCTNVCPTGATCAASVCACPLGTSSCAGACVNFTSDTRNCGTCGTVCATGQVCRTGTCQATCASGSTLCGTQCVTLGDDANNCGACGNRCASDATCASGVCVPVVTVDAIGCSDGTRESFTDRTRFPRIAGCSGAWSLPGIFPAIPAAALPACATLGNSSTTAPVNGAGCASSNLCARGWRICNGGDVTPRTASMGCAAETAYPASTFFAAAVSGTGCGICALRSGTVTGATCTATSCAGGCRESGDLNNDFFGCGTLGSLVSTSCDGLTRFSGNDCGSLGSPWICGGGTQESRTVTKTTAAAGGVLCCRD